MSRDAGRRNTSSMDVDNDNPEASQDVVDDSLLDVATGGSDSDDEMQNELQQLNIVESPNGPGIHITESQVSSSNSSLSDETSIIPARNIPSNSTYISADETIENTPLNIDRNI